ncbi:transcriptional regulator [Streptomyces asoensis]|uniref:Transcriptional regulator n=1 Tax=Streptomyces asoensis TaxID=249586 RepID=A0A6M4X2T1_9ACTN|nr:transcriptional regulator [Streptomyces asoensis]
MSHSPDPPSRRIVTNRTSSDYAEALSRKGQESIEVIFFSGSDAEAFLRAVEANVTHGLPLSQADRNAAAERIITSHPHMSDRAIARSAGLSARTVARIRQRVTVDGPDTVVRVGRDGKVRPLNSTDGRARAARLIAENPRASLREIAIDAGVSPGTVRDVRMRLMRGDDPTAVRQDAPAKAEKNATETPDVILEKLLRDPSLRHNEAGRHLLRLLQFHAKGDWIISAVPPHCTPLVADLAAHYGRMWLEFAQALEGRERPETSGPIAVNSSSV